MKIAIMIPARAGSKRVKNKNLRLLSGAPLISYVMETCSKLDYPVYVNTDDENILLFAEQTFPEINRYKRPDELASDTATNDEFMYDFMNNTDFDYVVQVLPTSPFITKEEIQDFIDTLVKKHLDTLVSVKDEQIGTVYANVPINFSKEKVNPPSQEMTPVQVYATSLMGWSVDVFKRNIKELGCAYHGGHGRTEYFPLKGFSKVDIDHEEDFRLAETIAQFLPFEDRYVPMYWEPGTYMDKFVPRVLKDDGVGDNINDKINQPVVNIYDILDKESDLEPWYKTLIDTESNSMTLVNQLSGQGNRKHFHSFWNECWIILRGKLRFDIEDESYIVGPGDLIMIEKGKRHKITNIGEDIATRLAISRYDVDHIYAEGREKK